MSRLAGCFSAAIPPQVDAEARAVRTEPDEVQSRPGFAQRVLPEQRELIHFPMPGASALQSDRPPAAA
jgi:hypothetical protein